MVSTHSVLRVRQVRRGFAGLFAVAAVAASFSAVPSPAQAKPPVPAFGPKELPLGRTHASWLGAWAKWAFKGAAETNPLLSLQACDKWEQPEPTTAWFLSANGPGTADVTCSVPANLPIALTPGGIFDWQNPGDEAKLTEYMRTFPNSVRKPTLSVDGVKVDATRYLVTSPVLTTKIIAPEFGPKAGPDKPEVVMQARGWMLVLKGLKPGTHKIVITDELSNLDDNGQPILVKGKPSWILSSVNYTLNAGSGPVATTTTTAAPTTTASAATTVAPSTTVASAPAGAKVLFKDDFSDPKSGWLDDNGGGWNMGYVDGKYKIAAEPGNGGHVGPGHTGQPNLRNTHMEIDFELTLGDGAFVVHCYDASPRGVNTSNASITTEPEHLYVGLSPKAGFGAYASVAGKRTSIPGANINAMTGAFRKENRLTIECSGESGKPGRVKVWLNNVPILDAPVPVMPAGDGISPSMEAFRGLTSKGELVFDNLVVSAL